MNTTTADAQDSTWSAEAQEQLRAEVRRVMEAESLNQAAISKDANIAYGTFTTWMTGKYQGNTGRVAGDVARWLESRQARKKVAAALPTAPGFLRTETAERILAIMQFAQAAADFAVVAGGAGIGKTSAAQHYRDTNPNVWLITLEPCSGRMNAVLNELCEAVGTAERNAARLSQAIARKIKGTGGLIIVDEANHAETAAIDQLRSIHDRTGVGVVLLGNETVYSRLEGEGRKAAFAQLYSRIGMRHSQARPRPADICQIIAAWGVTDPDEKRLLKAIARKPGALRGLTKVLTLAGMLAAGAEETRTARHIRQAWERLSPADNGARDAAA